MLAPFLKVNNTGFDPRFRSCPAKHYNMLHSSPIFNHIIYHIMVYILGGLGCCPFYGGGSVVVDALFIVLPIVCRRSVFVFVLLCITLCPF